MINLLTEEQLAKQLSVSIASLRRWQLLNRVPSRLIEDETRPTWKKRFLIVGRTKTDAGEGRTTR